MVIENFWVLGWCFLKGKKQDLTPFAREHCFNQLTDFESKLYTSKSVLEADVDKFLSCSMGLLWVYQPITK